MAQEPPWGPDDTSAVPVGPEPEPTGSGGAGAGGTGPGGWGEEPRTEPFAIAALVWAVVSIVIPLIGTIIALVLAGRAADSIRRSQGTRKGEELVTAARVVAGLVIALWAVGLVLFFALREDNDKNDVAIPTQPTVTSTLPPPTTTRPPTTTTPPTAPPTAPPTTAVQPTSVTIPPTTPPTAPPTTPPTSPPTTAPPTTAPPVTTSPDQKQAAILEERMLANPQLGPSNRGVPDSGQYVVQYTSGQPITVTWQINNGTPPLPSGPATCVPPTSTTVPATTTLVPPSSTTTSTTTTTTTLVPPSTTVAPGMSTKDLAHSDARQILRVLRQRRNDIDITSIQLVGIYPMTGNVNTEVVRVTYSADILDDPVNFPSAEAFQVPPAESLQCINPAFQ